MRRTTRPIAGGYLGDARNLVVSRGVQIAHARAQNAGRQTVDALRLKFGQALADFHRLFESFERRAMILGEPYDEAIAILKAATGARVAAELYGTPRQIGTARHDHTRALCAVAVALVLLPDEHSDAAELEAEPANEGTSSSSIEEPASVVTVTRIEDRIIEAGAIIARARRKARGEHP